LERKKKKKEEKRKRRKGKGDGNGRGLFVRRMETSLSGFRLGKKKGKGREGRGKCQEVDSR